MTTYVDRVRRGAALLDERGPADWRDRLDRDALDLRWCHTCVVGQVYRDEFDLDEYDGDDEDRGYDAYDHGVTALLSVDDYALIHIDQLIAHGFEELTGGDYDALTTAWLDHLRPTATTDEETSTP